MAALRTADPGVSVLLETSQPRPRSRVHLRRKGYKRAATAQGKAIAFVVENMAAMR